jgi:hypothetical protein
MQATQSFFAENYPYDCTVLSSTFPRRRLNNNEAPPLVRPVFGRHRCVNNRVRPC